MQSLTRYGWTLSSDKRRKAATQLTFARAARTSWCEQSGKGWKESCGWSYTWAHAETHNSLPQRSPPWCSWEKLKPPLQIVIIIIVAIQTIITAVFSGIVIIIFIILITCHTSMYFLMLKQGISYQKHINNYESVLNCKTFPIKNTVVLFFLLY